MKKMFIRKSYMDRLIINKFYSGMIVTGLIGSSFVCNEIRYNFSKACQDKFKKSVSLNHSIINGGYLMGVM